MVGYVGVKDSVAIPDDALFTWNAHASIVKYSPDQVAYAVRTLGYEPAGYRLGLITTLIEGGAGTPSLIPTRWWA
jgi:hypothetical protein